MKNQAICNEPAHGAIEYLSSQSASESGRVRITPTDGRPAVVFEGLLVASVDTQRPNSGRWTEIDIFRTRRGRYVIAQIGVSTIPGDQCFCSIEVSKSLQAISEHLGYSKLAAKIYANLNIEEVCIP